MLVPPPAVTRIPVEVFTRHLSAVVCPIGSCRQPVANHTWYDVNKYGAVACSAEEE